MYRLCFELRPLLVTLRCESKLIRNRASKIFRVFCSTAKSVRTITFLYRYTLSFNGTTQNIQLKRCFNYIYGVVQFLLQMFQVITPIRVYRP